MLTKDELMNLLRKTSAEEAVAGLFYVTAKDLPDFASAVIAAHTAKVLEGVEPFVFEEYPYNSHAMGCGLEDRDITDRYEAMAYGWERAMERAAEAIPDDLYPASTVSALKSRADALAARVVELEKDAGRLDYIEENARCEPKMDGHHVWWPTTFSNQLKGPNLRAAIDAAIAAKGQA